MGFPANLPRPSRLTIHARFTTRHSRLVIRAHVPLPGISSKTHPSRTAPNGMRGPANPPRHSRRTIHHSRFPIPRSRLAMRALPRRVSFLYTRLASRTIRCTIATPIGVATTPRASAAPHAHAIDPATRERRHTPSRRTRERDQACVRTCPGRCTRPASPHPSASVFTCPATRQHLPVVALPRGRARANLLALRSRASHRAQRRLAR